MVEEEEAESRNSVNKSHNSAEVKSRALDVSYPQSSKKSKVEEETVDIQIELDIVFKDNGIGISKD